MNFNYKKHLPFAIIFLFILVTFFAQFLLFYNSQNIEPHILLEGKIGSFELHQLKKITDYKLEIAENSVIVLSDGDLFFYQKFMEELKMLSLESLFIIHDYSEVNLVFKDRFDLSKVIFELNLILIIFSIILFIYKNFAQKIKVCNHYFKEYLNLNIVDFFLRIIIILILVFAGVFLIIDVMFYRPHIDLSVFNLLTVTDFDTYYNYFTDIVTNGNYSHYAIAFIILFLMQLITLIVNTIKS